MARATVNSNMTRQPAYEPLYDVDPRNGAAVEVFFADNVLAKSFGSRTGWYWWRCRRGFVPDRIPTGPFATSYAAYRNFASGCMATLSATSFGQRHGIRRSAADGAEIAMQVNAIDCW